MKSARVLALALAPSLALVACASSSDSGAPPPAAGSAGAAGASGTAGMAGSGAVLEGDYDPAPVGGARPAKVYVPGSYLAGTPTPLLVLLHGYGASGIAEEIYLGLRPIADEKGFLLVHPDGTIDASKRRFWNATDACCDFGNSQVDDVGYLSGLVDEIAARFTVDPSRVMLLGHSNGGYMSHRLACDRSAKFSAIASLAGMTWADDARCGSPGPIAVLQIHGTADDTVPFDGETFQGTAQPSAAATVAKWAAFGGCAVGPTEAPALDLDRDLVGAETTVTAWSGCKPGAAAELWAIQKGSHVPALSRAGMTRIVEFLLAHKKP